MDFRKSYRIYHIAVWVFLALGCCLRGWRRAFGIEGSRGIVIMVLGMGQTVFFCKCPYCGSNSDIRAKLPKFCPACGKRLED